MEGTTVYAAHSKENVDEPTMKQVVAIDATGQSEMTKTHEQWRAPLEISFASPTAANGRLYVIDNAANLHALDATTGKHL